MRGPIDFKTLSEKLIVAEESYKARIAALENVLEGLLRKVLGYDGINASEAKGVLYGTENSFTRQPWKGRAEAAEAERDKYRKMIEENNHACSCHFNETGEKALRWCAAHAVERDRLREAGEWACNKRFQ